MTSNQKPQPAESLLGLAEDMDAPAAIFIALTAKLRNGGVPEDAIPSIIHSMAQVMRQSVKRECIERRIDLAEIELAIARLQA